MQTNDSIGSVCMKAEITDKDWSCACQTCTRLEPPKKPELKDSFGLFLADFKAQQNT